jgi:hypothetical protein
MSGTGTIASAVERIIGSARSAASRLVVYSALNPMLWMCGIVSLPCFCLAYFFREVEPLCNMLTYVGAAPVVATIVGFFYFMIFAPEKLQSEEFQLRQQSLEIIKQKGSSVQITRSSLEAISNPSYRGLPKGDGR